MNGFFNWLQGKKTYITGAASVLGGVAAVATGTISPVEGVQLALQGLLGIFIRNGIANK
jgi:hypothetical protein